MTVARSVGDVLGEHVVFEIECIDRMYLNVYVPGLQYAGGSRNNAKAEAAYLAIAVARRERAQR